MRAKFGYVEDGFSDLFGLRARAMLEEAAAHGDVDLRGWTLHLKAGSPDAHADWYNRRMVIGEYFATLPKPLRKFVMLHELGHIRQVNAGRLEYIDFLRVRWDGVMKYVDLSTPRRYVAQPWERDASDFALASPLFEEVTWKMIHSTTGTLRDTLAHHLKKEVIA